jgi:PAS domain S-box-containing protein
MNDNQKSKEQLINELIQLRQEIIILKQAASDPAEMEQNNSIPTEDKEDWFRSLFEQSSDGIFYMDFDGKIAAVNSSFARLHGYTIEEILNMNISDLDCNESLELFPERFRRVIAGENLKFEVEHFHRDGHRIPLEVTSGIVSLGNEKYLMASHRDITERKQAAESLRVSEENFRILFDESPIPTILSELPSGKITFANKKISAILNLDPSELQGKTPNELGLLKNSEDQEKLTGMIAAHGYIDNVELDKDLPDGQIGTDLVFMRVVTINGKQHCLSVVHDISDRKKAEEALIRAKEKAEESDRLKSAFLANMSHEIRTPMNGILGFAELLKNPRLTGEEQNDYLNIIEKSGARMLNLINDLIDISKIESGQMKVSVSPFNLNSQTEFIYDFFQPVVVAKGLAFSINNGLSFNDSIIKSDNEKVNAILINLIKNAIKFTDKGAIDFGYVLRPSGKINSTQVLEFYVRDTGVGISPEQKAIIFERFRQGSESLNRNYEGAGLGLSIARSYVEMLGGEIRVESPPANHEETNGTVFYFTVPYVAEYEENELDVMAEQVSVHEAQFHDLRVLIAEDDDVSEMYLSRLLKPFSKDILKAKTGVDAVEACRNNPGLSLVLMDMKMPEMDGYEATRQIRHFNKDIIIIAQTAYAQTGDKEKALKAGCDDYIVKPVMKDILFDLLKKHSGKSGIKN